MKNQVMSAAFLAGGRRAHLRLGQKGEAVVRKLFLRRGCPVLAADWRCPYGELDIVARDGAELVFAEVKTLRREGVYRPADNLSRRQLRRDLRAAAYFRERFASDRFPWRFELVEVIYRNFRSIRIRRSCIARS